MNVKYLGVLGLIFVTSCAAVAIPTSSTKTIYDVIFEVNGCSISADRKAVCSLHVTSKYRDRIVAIGNGASLQDSTGENYPASVRFGKGTWSKTLIADSPYELNFTVENVSTKATSVRAIIINTIGVSLGPKQHVGGQHQVIFSNPKMLQSPKTNPVRTVKPAVATAVDKAETEPEKAAKPEIVPSNTTQTSRVKSSSTFEVGINLPFGDIAAHVLPNADPTLCLAFCEANDQCLSWTYVKPGIQGPTAMCWIKNVVPVKVPDPNTTSGVMTR